MKKFLGEEGLVYLWNKVIEEINSKQEVIESVTATIDNNVGTPKVVTTFNDGVLSFIFKNLKGEIGNIGPQGPQGNPFTYSDFTPEQLAGLKGQDGAEIESVTPIQLTEESDGVNIYKITLSNGNTFNFTTRNGKKGDKGDQGESAVFDPETGNILATLEDSTGQSTVNAMSQKAVTDELENINNKIINQVFLTEEAYNALVDIDEIDENTLYNIYEEE